MLAWRTRRCWRCAPLRLAAALGLALALSVSLAGCNAPLNFEQLSGAPSATSSYRVVMGIASFYPTKVTINAGQSVIFTDPTDSGGVHFICVGAGLTCAPIAGTPQLLAQSSGLFFQNGSAAVPIQFNTPGEYSVTCVIHPGMTMRVVVK